MVVSTDTGHQSAAPFLKGYAKVGSLTISGLNEFVMTAPSQDINFMCSGKVTGIKMDKGWCYVGCSKCTKKTGTHGLGVHMWALRQYTYAVGPLPYQVEMGIADDTAEGVFAGFDGVMTKLRNLKASKAGHMLVSYTLNSQRWC